MFFNYQPRNNAMAGNTLRQFLSRPSALFHHRALNNEFDEELETHIALLAERFERQGLSSQKALYAAQRQLGKPASSGSLCAKSYCWFLLVSPSQSP